MLLTPPAKPRRFAIAAVSGLVAASALLAAAPASAAPTAYGPGLRQCEGTAPIVCTYPDLAPGSYDVTVRIDAGTEVYAEARRLLRAADADGGRSSFTVNVRTPEGQQNNFSGAPGTPGLTLTFTGEAPSVDSIRITPANRATVRLALLGDSTVTDQENPPYTGWGQRLPDHFGRGVSVINHSGSGESTVSMLSKPEMFDALLPQLRRGDVALIQLAHNDKETTAEQYRANLTEMVTRIRQTGAEPVLVTPIVRHRFSGAELNSTGLIVTGLADLPAEMRTVAADLEVPLIDLTAETEALVEGLGPVDAEPLYLIRINGDRTHTSEYGATVYAGIVAEKLHGLGLIPERLWR
ncbi:rhamnogalacturonan acetylesterase [Microbacterium sp. GXF0217]